MICLNFTPNKRSPTPAFCVLWLNAGGAGPHERPLRDEVSVCGEHHHYVLPAPAAEPAGVARFKLQAGVRVPVYPDRVQREAAPAPAGHLEDRLVQGPRHARAGAQHA